MNKITAAREFARKKHTHLKRKDGKTPYFYHLGQVFTRARQLGVTNTNILCAAWLHDTIEDTNTDYDDIKERFGKKVADIVAAVTKDNRLEEKQREIRYLNQLKKSPWEAKVVKLCDIIANVADLENTSYDMRKKREQIKKKLVYFKAIKSGISEKRSAMPRLEQTKEKFNQILSRYGKYKIGFT